MPPLESITKETPRTPRGLGSLESQLMELLWSYGRLLSGQEILSSLEGEHNYKTVMTVLNRLVEKNLLTRTLKGKAYLYEPVENRESFLRSIAFELVKSYQEAYGSEGLDHILQAVEIEKTGYSDENRPASSFTNSARNSELLSKIATLLTIVIGLEFFRMLWGRK